MHKCKWKSTGKGKRPTVDIENIEFKANILYDIIAC